MERTEGPTSRVPKPRHFNPSFDKRAVKRMMDQVRCTGLPEDPPFPDAGWDEGTDLSWLKRVKEQWEKTFSQDRFEETLCQWPNYMVKFDEEDIDLHFVHARSQRTDAVPILLLHGWPGSYLDFHKVIGPMASPSSNGSVAYHVVVPSLPGYAFSTYPRRSPFTLVEIGQIFHRLMTEVLGYEQYVLQGGDWGSFIARSMLASPSIASHIPVAHLNMYFAIPPAGRIVQTLSGLVPSYFSYIPGYDALTTYLGTRLKRCFSKAELHGIERSMEFRDSGNGYVALQSTKPLTIGYALNDAPLGLLAYIGEKFYAWSDPSTMLSEDLIQTVALYHLTQSFHTSVMIYHQSKAVVDDQVRNPGKWKFANPVTKLGFSNYPFEIGAAPRSFFKGIANLKQYNEHASGGHFAALDNPRKFVEDLRDLTASHWTTHLVTYAEGRHIEWANSQSSPPL